MDELSYAELTQGRELTRVPHTLKLTSLKIKFPFKRKILPSHPSCSHLRQPIKLSLNFNFPRCTETDWNGSSFEKVESLDTIEPITTSVLCQFMTIKTFSR